MFAPIKKSFHPNEPWKKMLARYPRLVACMIDESLGYFTPHAAVNAIVAHKTKEYWSYEWYMDIDARRHDNKIRWNDPDYNSRIMAINHDVISEAFKKRKYYLNSRAKSVVKANLGENESVLAAWF